VVEAVDAFPFTSVGVRFVEGAAEEELGREEVTPAAFCDSSGAVGCSPPLTMLGGMMECEVRGEGYE
jgi:hypothetical protein